MTVERQGWTCLWHVSAESAVFEPGVILLTLNHANENESSTRRHLVWLIKTQGPLSTSHLTNQLSITDAAVRHHLHALEKEGLIQSKTVHQSMGRPTLFYRLTEAGNRLFPAGYHTLALDLLDELIQEFGTDSVDRVFRNRMKAMRKNYELKINGKSLQEKIGQLANIQHENGYMAEWAENGDEPGQYVLTEHHCPVIRIADPYSQVCRYELELFEALLDAEVKRTDCIAQNGRSCVYLIQSRK
ncbi:helix-turn-helix transcriptional regulator [Paenibacillus sp. MBLB4367]|uniref:helix-turn-helix transcriptional regulator n=1 Tax=Paenibacillus sp. MBLB4367 TaxID=3384767 RepID=UPI0039082970